MIVAHVAGFGVTYEHFLHFDDFLLPSLFLLRPAGTPAKYAGANASRWALAVDKQSEV